MNWSGPGSISAPNDGAYISKILCIEQWNDRVPQNKNKHYCGQVR